ncbi:aminoacyl-histidine dipeptidase [Fictibacillus fluitans]|uniref:Aminoacyl-histidine dipeptidase n=1 Tax=Fictibacillus fluitans TaxID=3058422 RepID=A0ABT8HUE5_9BACL|nr:aminoacyl-histidine dipeptidase [Fictibacillus sp. NE201]MDN4524397.1 aminoacyl-histidine dipeptidase [Fictibacillus sp. NE201]
MNKTLTELTNHPVFHYFAELSSIPRGSGNEKEVSGYLLRFAEKRKLAVIQDEALNIIIKKEATAGYEHVPAIILQGHMDMVCEKNKGTAHDFDKDPLQLQIKEDMLFASGTTLGADNGIAVAYALALLDANDLPHPALEVVITTEEETTMKGALEVSPDHFSGEVFINLDSEEEGKLLVSSAGGITASQNLPIQWEPLTGDTSAFLIQITGLYGGHSGMSIHKGRGNANKLLGRLLNGLSEAFDFRLSLLSGGLKSNAIPREAEAVIHVPEAHASRVPELADIWESIFKEELRTSDSRVSVTAEKVNLLHEQVYSAETTGSVINSIMLIPNGVQSMSQEIEGLTESSTNLGVISSSASAITFVSEIRSSVKSLKEQILKQNERIARMTGSSFTTQADYPEWPYRKDSKVQKLFEEVYENHYGKRPEIVAIHAGLECGIFTEKLPHIDAISLGPDMFDVHTPEEHLSIPSTIRTWEYLLSALREMKAFYS